MLAAVVLASALTVINYLTGAGGVFEILVLITTFSATVPYLLAAGAQVYFLLTGRRDKVRPARFARDLTLALAAFGFTFWLVAGAGYAAIYQGVLFLFAGILVYAWMAARRTARQEEAEQDAELDAKTQTDADPTRSRPGADPEATAGSAYARGPRRGSPTRCRCRSACAYELISPVSWYGTPISAQYSRTIGWAWRRFGVGMLGNRWCSIW